MRKVKIYSRQDFNQSKPELKNFSKFENRRIMEKELEFFRHLCEDPWLESLLDELKFKKKKITPSRMRKIITGAIRKRMETGSRGY